MIDSYFIDMFRKEKNSGASPAPPLWLREALAELKKFPNLQEGSEFLRHFTGKTKEHICRSFKKYLGATPTEYINELRLNYVANMLLHSDREILDLAFDAGFENISYFYQKFKARFHVPPGKFREKQTL